MAQRGRRTERHRDHNDGHEHDHDRERNHGGSGRHPGRGDGDDEESGDNPARQAAVIAQRWVGSVPPTYELFAQARQQWLKLPGAMSHAAADVQLPAASSPVTPPPEAQEQSDREDTP